MAIIEQVRNIEKQVTKQVTKTSEDSVPTSIVLIWRGFGHSFFYCPNSGFGQFFSVEIY